MNTIKRTTSVRWSLKSLIALVAVLHQVVLGKVDHFHGRSAVEAVLQHSTRCFEFALVTTFIYPTLFTKLDTFLNAFPTPP